MLPSSVITLTFAPTTCVRFDWLVLVLTSAAAIICMITRSFAGLGGSTTTSYMIRMSNPRYANAVAAKSNKFVLLSCFQKRGKAAQWRLRKLQVRKCLSHTLCHQLYI